MTNPIHDPTHPIWPLLRLIVMMVSLTIVLYLSASNFDNSELKTILTMFLIGGGIEGVGTLFRGKK